MGSPDGITTCRLKRVRQSKHLKIIKRIMNVALARGLHDNRQHQGGAFYVHNGRSSNKIYLTEGEMEHFRNLDLSHNETLQRELDRFLLAYYFLLRFSDVTRLSRELFFKHGDETFLRIVHRETGREVVLPVKPDAQELLERYDYDLSFSSNQDANRHLKTIAAMAGINQAVKQGEDSGPKSSFVTTHTARRSAATNLYLNGASLKMIADLGGWENTDILRLYLRASGLESARMARGLDFFR